MLRFRVPIILALVAAFFAMAMSAPADRGGEGPLAKVSALSISDANAQLPTPVICKTPWPWACNGTHQGDTLYGTAARNHINGLGARDFLRGFGGRDLLKGGNGHDGISGDRGADVLYGGHGGDAIGGDAGNDRLYAGCASSGSCPQGGEQPDYLFGGSGDDRLFMNNGKRDYYACGLGYDYVRADRFDRLNPDPNSGVCEVLDIRSG